MKVGQDVIGLTVGYDRNTERERFERVYPRPHNVRFIESGNYYQAQEPYVWGSDTAAANLNRQWETWQYQAATIADLQQQLTEANRRGDALRDAAKELIRCKSNKEFEIGGCMYSAVLVETMDDLQEAVATATSKRGG